MKNLLIFLLLAASVGLYFHDKQETADLAKSQTDLDSAQSQNSELTQKVNNLQRQVANMQARMQQMSMGSALQTQHPLQPSASPFGSAGSLQGGSLDRGAYKN
ncbi:MAG TPA: hypothetical protein VHY22_07285 [Chthoniobacteraceae bacterium]|nr:hypothetical protein [Chthoniobacteraceae bacterium]